MIHRFLCRNLGSTIYMLNDRELRAVLIWLARSEECAGQLLDRSNAGVVFKVFRMMMPPVDPMSERTRAMVAGSAAVGLGSRALP